MAKRDNSGDILLWVIAIPIVLIYTLIKAICLFFINRIKKSTQPAISRSAPSKPESDDFIEWEAKLKKLRKCEKVPHRDVLWYKYSTTIYNAEVNQDIGTLQKYLWDAAVFLMEEQKYKKPLTYFLEKMYLDAASKGLDFIQTMKRLFREDAIENDFSFLGYPGDCVLALNLKIDEIVGLFMNQTPKIRMLDVTKEMCLPAIRKAYRELMKEKREYEKQTGKTYRLKAVKSKKHSLRY